MTSKTTRVVHLTCVHSPFDVRIYEKECRSLARGGYDVVLVAPHDGDRKVEGVTVKGLHRQKTRLARMSMSVLETFDEARHQNADVYHFHDPELLPVGWLLSMRGKKVIYDAHEDAPRTIQNKTYIPRLFRPWLEKFLELLELRLAARFAAVVAATPTIANRFYGVNANTCIVNNYPIVQGRRPTPWTERELSVVYAGTITEARGIRQLVDSMERLRTVGATLMLAGSFKPETLLNDIQRRPGWQRVNYLGFLPSQRVADLLSRVRAGLVVLHPKSNYLLSQPVKLYEYMAAGIPVIASDFPLWRSIVDSAGCGLLVDPLDPAAIANAIHYILSHPSEAEAMGQRGREAIEQRFNWVSEESTLFSLYESITGGVATNQ